MRILPDKQRTGGRVAGNDEQKKIRKSVMVSEKERGTKCAMDKNGRQSQHSKHAEKEPTVEKTPSPKNDTMTHPVEMLPGKVYLGVS